MNDETDQTTDDFMQAYNWAYEAGRRMGVAVAVIDSIQTILKSSELSPESRINAALVLIATCNVIYEDELEGA